MRTNAIKPQGSVVSPRNLVVWGREVLDFILDRTGSPCDEKMRALLLTTTVRARHAITANESMNPLDDDTQDLASAHRGPDSINPIPRIRISDSQWRRSFQTVGTRTAGESTSHQWLRAQLLNPSHPEWWNRGLVAHHRPTHQPPSCSSCRSATVTSNK